MKAYLLNFYRFILCRRIFYKFNTHLYKLSLRGLGVLNSEGPRVTGERHLFENILVDYNIKVVFDIGANTGGYSLQIKRKFPKATIYAFEPNPKIFKILKKNVNKENIKAFNIGFSNKKGKSKLWDFADDAKLKHTQPTSTLSSIYKDVIVKYHKQKPKSYNVKLETIDDFVLKNKIKKIDFLKTDTEGSEFEILEGANNLLSKGKIKVIQFEFNEMNVFSRVFLKDFRLT